MIGVDWGTTRLRAWLLSAEGAVLDARANDAGMGGLAPADFAPTLRALLVGWDTVPVVMCGMVGARQGWIEAAYAPVPGVLSALPAMAVRAPGLDVPAYILPGLAQNADGACDVMRGEETQLLGLIADDPEMTGTVALPGTHGKWVWLERGHVRRFATAMTGEVFAVLRQHSILRHSLGANTNATDPNDPAFLDGVSQTMQAPGTLLSALFGLRAEQLLRDTPAQALTARMSGLLIGAELAGMLDGLRAPQVTLIASGPLAALYQTALTRRGLAVTTHDAETLVRRGLAVAAQRLFAERP